MGKRVFLFGFILVLLLGIPAGLFFLKTQEGPAKRTTAQKASTLSFTPTTSQSGPLQKNINDTFDVDIQIDPGVNKVNAIRLQINYDPLILTTAGAGFVKNTSIFPEGESPDFSPGKIIITLSTGFNPLSSVQRSIKVGTLTFQALTQTPNGIPTTISISNNITETIVSSNNRITDAVDENVLASTVPIYIAIGASLPLSGTPPPTPTGHRPPVTPTTPNTPPIAPPIAPTTPVVNNPPSCLSLTADKALSGTAPYSLIFSASGNDDTTITLATFNFGDGKVSNIVQGSGIGTNSVSNAQASHTYTTPGTYTVTVVFTDNARAVSTTTSCTQTVTVAQAENTPTPIVQTPQITPPGPGQAILGIGTIGISLTILGIIIFLSL